MALRKFVSNKMNAHVVAYKKALVKKGLKEVKGTLDAWKHKVV